MSFWFTIKEGLKGFGRARLATSITITSISFALLLIAVILSFSFNIENLISGIKKSIELEVFLEADLNKVKSLGVKKKIEKLAGIQGVQLITKDDAAKRFEAEFGRNVYEVLGDNPLPPSCTIKVKQDYHNSKALLDISTKIAKIDGVGEVVYRKDIIRLIERYVSYIYLGGGSVSLLLVLLTTILIYNTVRLTILARKDIIAIMQLVGATRFFIRRPFIIEGFLQGLFGAAAGSLLFYLLSRVVQKFLFSALLIKPEIFLIITLIGAFLGIISSAFSVSRHLKGI